MRLLKPIKGQQLTLDFGNLAVWSSNFFLGGRKIDGRDQPLASDAEKAKATLLRHLHILDLTVDVLTELVRQPPHAEVKHVYLQDNGQQFDTGLTRETTYNDDGSVDIVFYVGDDRTTQAGSMHVESNDDGLLSATATDAQGVSETIDIQVTENNDASVTLRIDASVEGGYSSNGTANVTDDGTTTTWGIEVTGPEGSTDEISVNVDDATGTITDENGNVLNPSEGNDDPGDNPGGDK